MKNLRNFRQNVYSTGLYFFKEPEQLEGFLDNDLYLRSRIDREFDNALDCRSEELFNPYEYANGKYVFMWKPLGNDGSIYIWSMRLDGQEYNTIFQIETYNMPLPQFYNEYEPIRRYCTNGVFINAIIKIAISLLDEDLSGYSRKIGNSSYLEDLIIKVVPEEQKDSYKLKLKAAKLLIRQI